MRVVRPIVALAMLSTSMLGAACDSTLDPVGAAPQVDASPSIETDARQDAAPLDTDASPDLVGRWTLDSNPNDSVGNNHGTLLGAASFQNDAERGQVLACNGTDAAVRVTNAVAPSFTFAAWIWSDTPSSTGSTTLDGDPLIWSNEAARIDDFALALLNDHLSYVNYNETSTGTAMVTDAKWHHVAATRLDGERVALYVDGKVDGDGNSGSGVVSANANVYLCGLPGGRHFKGLLDDVRLYDRVLSPIEMSALYTSTR